MCTHFVSQDRCLGEAFGEGAKDMMHPSVAEVNTGSQLCAIAKLYTVHNFSHFHIL